MLNLLTAERLKLVRGKKLWIALSILFLLPIIQVVNSQMNVHYGTALVQPIDTVVNGATGVLMIKKNGLTVLLVISAFISFFIGEEFHNGTIRNALALGRSRMDYYVSKFVMAALVSFAGVTGMTIIGVISFTVVFGFGDVPGIDNYFGYAVKTFGTLYVLILANIAVYVMISFLTKNSSFSLIWSFLYTIATGFLPGIFQQTERFKQVTNWFTETFLFYTGFVKHDEIAQYPEMVLVSLMTIMLSSAVGIHLFKRTDIK